MSGCSSSPRCRAGSLRTSIFRPAGNRAGHRGRHAPARGDHSVVSSDGSTNRRNGHRTGASESGPSRRPASGGWFPRFMIARSSVRIRWTSAGRDEVHGESVRTRSPNERLEGAVGAQATRVRSRLRTRTSSVESVPTCRVRPLGFRNSTSRPPSGSSSTTVPTSPERTSGSPELSSTATISNSFKSRAWDTSIAGRGLVGYRI